MELLINIQKIFKN